MCRKKIKVLDCTIRDGKIRTNAMIFDLNHQKLRVELLPEYV